jgi:hypothetical protein
MTCRMDFRRTPESDDWLGSFNCYLRDVIDKRCGRLATQDDLEFFKGMEATYSDSDDQKSLQKVIEILEDGGTVDFEITC